MTDFWSNPLFWIILTVNLLVLASAYFGGVRRGRHLERLICHEYLREVVAPAVDDILRGRTQ